MSLFDPASIDRFKVIRLPYQFPGSPYRTSKLFVVLGHQSGYAICIKATSQVEIYLNNEKLMAGCVFYKGGDLKCFPKDTVIQPDNLIPIPYGELQSCHAKAEIDLLQTLPLDIEGKLRSSIERSVTMSQAKKRIVLGILNG